MLQLILHCLPRPLHQLILRVGYRVHSQLRRRMKRPVKGVSLIASDEAGRILLVRHSYGPDEWCFPGGGMDRGETAEQTARRELREELDTDGIGLRSLGTIEESLSGAPHTAHVFALRLTDGWRIDGRELVEARFFKPDGLPAGLSRRTMRRVEMWRAAQDGGGAADPLVNP